MILMHRMITMIDAGLAMPSATYDLAMKFADGG